jgi:glycosyltransferase involved in cell wall biosynthesis
MAQTLNNEAAAMTKHDSISRTDAKVIRVGIFDQIVSGGGVRLFTTKLLEAFSKLAGERWRFHLMWPWFDSSNNFLPRPRLPRTTFERINVDEMGSFQHRIFPLLQRLAGGVKISASVHERLKAYLEEIRKREQQNLRSAEALGLRWLDKRIRKFDLIYFPYPYLTLPREGEWHPCRPLVVTLHDLAQEQTDAWGEMTKPLRREVRAWTGLSDLVIFSSDFIKDEAQKIYGLPDDRARRIYLAPPEGDKKSAAPVDLFKRYGLQKGYIFTLGWAAKHKRVETVLEGFALFKKESRRDISLVIAGPNTESLRKGPTYGMEIGKDVHALGYVKDEDIPWLYRNASLVVTASVSEAGFNAVIFDAMYYRKAIICSHIPQFVERLGTDETLALTFDPDSPRSLADAMQRHFAEPEVAALRVANAKKFISSRTLNDVGREYLSAFESVLRRHKEAPTM